MKQILITGSNRGIGLAVVEQYLAIGETHIFATCRNPHKAKDLHRLQRQYPQNLTIVSLEVISFLPDFFELRTSIVISYISVKFNRFTPSFN